MYWQHYCTGSTTVLVEGAARVASVLTICIRPTRTYHIVADTHQNARRRDSACDIEDKAEGGRKAVSIDEVASTADRLGSWAL